MIPAKEAKDMLYMLLSQNLVQLQVHANTRWTVETPKPPEIISSEWKKQNHFNLENSALLFVGKYESRY